VGNSAAAAALVAAAAAAIARGVGTPRDGVAKPGVPHLVTRDALENSFGAQGFKPRASPSRVLISGSRGTLLEKTAVARGGCCGCGWMCVLESGCVAAGSWCASGTSVWKRGACGKVKAGAVASIKSLLHNCESPNVRVSASSAATKDQQQKAALNAVHYARPEHQSAPHHTDTI
jgi:hypothetical protein